MKRIETRLTQLEAKGNKMPLPVTLDLSALGAAQAKRITEAEDWTALPDADLVAILEAPRIVCHD